MFLMGIFTTLEEAVAYDKLSDEKLLLRVAQGDKEAFQRLYQNTDKTIYGFILSILRNPQDAEEIMQETYLKIWTSAAGYKSQGKPLAWMFTIARNLCFDYQQRKKEAGKNLRSYEAENENGILKISENTKNIQQYPDICGTDKMKEMEDYLYLKGLLNRLSQEVREVIILRAYEELKFKDIAKMMNCSLSTAKSRYRIGIQQMKNMIKEGDQ